MKLPGKNILMVRHGECMANHSGTIAGNTDSRLTIKGNRLIQKVLNLSKKNKKKQNV